MSRRRQQIFSMRRRHSIKNRPVVPNVGMKGVRKAKSAAVNVGAILPPGSKRSRTLTARAAAAASSKKAPKVFKTSKNPFGTKGKHSMAKALNAIVKEEGNYSSNTN